MAADPVCYYHCWAGDKHHGSAWREPAEEFVTALLEAEFPGKVRVGISGGLAERMSTAPVFARLGSAADICAAEPEGFEQVTIEAMHQWAKVADPATPVLYAHTKGAFNATSGNARWRRVMTEHVVGGWRECVAALADHEVAGCHWLTPEAYPEHISPGKPMFGGNFWWARAGYLAVLPPVETANRWGAEGWLGRGNPKALDLLAGWPYYP